MTFLGATTRGDTLQDSHDQPADQRVGINELYPPHLHCLTFSDILTMTDDLAQKLPNRPWKGILAVTRGGLVPAGILSQTLDIRRIEVINMKSYEDKQQSHLEVLNQPHLEGDEENWIIVDDLSDSGKTLKHIKDLYPKAFYAVLLVKPNGKEVPDLFSQEFPQDIWIHFPWEPQE